MVHIQLAEKFFGKTVIPGFTHRNEQYDPFFLKAAVSKVICLTSFNASWVYTVLLSGGRFNP